MKLFVLNADITLNKLSGLKGLKTQEVLTNGSLNYFIIISKSSATSYTASTLIFNRMRGGDHLI